MFIYKEWCQSCCCLDFDMRQKKRMRKSEMMSSPKVAKNLGHHRLLIAYVLCKLSVQLRTERKKTSFVGKKGGGRGTVLWATVAAIKSNSRRKQQEEERRSALAVAVLNLK